jgi:molybdopterin molybdotransferase
MVTTAKAQVIAPEFDACAAKTLLSVPEACVQAARFVRPILQTEYLPLVDAVGRTLARDIEANVAIPPFTQSAMDGYALKAGTGLKSGARLRVIGRIAAGQISGRLKRGQAMRLFTGAPLPEGADAVIMQENTARDSGYITLQKAIRPGDNVRHRGEDIDPPERLLAKGTRLDARHVGLLAAQGILSVNVVVRARIVVISTGDELRQPGQPLAPSAIYDSNRPMLLGLIRQTGHVAIDGGWVPDQPAAIAARLREMAGLADIVITSGGASVGEEDHAASAVQMAGGQAHILKIALKPGKPAVVGTIGEAAYLGLPGNPVSSLVSWLILGHAMLAALEGRLIRQRLGCPMRSVSYFNRRPGRAEFVPARLVETDKGVAVEILGKGGSARLRPLVEADGLAEINAMNEGVVAGDTVLFHPFNDGFSV